MLFKKSVIMSSIKGSDEKAVANFEYQNGEYLGSIRLYNFSSEPQGILTLGFYDGVEVVKLGLNRREKNVYNFKTDQIKDLSSFTCVLINFKDGKPTPLLQSGGKETVTQQNLISAICDLEKSKTYENVRKVLDDHEIEFESAQEIEKEIDYFINKAEAEACDSDCDKCASCKYRDAFYKTGEEKESEPIDIPQKEAEEAEPSFFDGIKDQIDELFERYPQEEFLSQILPNSKWAKIDYEEKGEYYVVGLIYEEGRIKYVCYGVPGMYSHKPPQELQGFSDWLPLDSAKPEGFGYWLTYQDADNGENIKITYNS